METVVFCLQVKLTLPVVKEPAELSELMGYSPTLGTFVLPRFDFSSVWEVLLTDSRPGWQGISVVYLGHMRNGDMVISPVQPFPLPQQQRKM